MSWLDERCDDCVYAWKAGWRLGVSLWGKIVSQPQPVISLLPRVDQTFCLNTRLERGTTPVEAKRCPGHVYIASAVSLMCLDRSPVVWPRRPEGVHCGRIELCILPIYRVSN